MNVAVVDTRCANVASMISALNRVGGEAELVDTPERVRNAPFVVLPGVGAFGAAIERLQDLKLVVPLRERLERSAPTLCVCVGFQLLFEGSAESPGTHGLGILRGEVRRFSQGVRVPQFGWNRVIPAAQMQYVREGYAYFANSYFVPAISESGFRYASATHGQPFVAAIERGRLLGCQFHPELSSDYGLGVLQRWLAGETQVAAC